MKELRTKTESELMKLLADKREALRVFRFSIAGSKTRNVREGRGIKKTIAHIMTLLNDSTVTSK
jgi:ribosomal protein L29